MFVNFVQKHRMVCVCKSTDWSDCADRSCFFSANISLLSLKTYCINISAIPRNQISKQKIHRLISGLYFLEGRMNEKTFSNDILPKSVSTCICIAMSDIYYATVEFTCNYIITCLALFSIRDISICLRVSSNTSW